MYRSIAALSICASLVPCLGAHSGGAGPDRHELVRSSRAPIATPVRSAPHALPPAIVAVGLLFSGRVPAPPGVAELCAASRGEQALARSGCARPMRVSSSRR